jgi:peptidoglycan/LPS O-acetylase OafA/YrhL
MRLSYFPQLDGLRAIAVLSVMTGHFSSSPTLGKLVGYGDTGVVIFFCLSGFLITGILLDLRGYDIAPGLVTFYARRGLRIFPIYYFVILMSLAVGCEPVMANLLRLATYTANYVPGLPVVTGLGPAAHLWSLSVEEQFYLVWPLVILAAPRPLLMAIIVATICASEAMKIFYAVTDGSYKQIFSSVFSCMDSLGVGALLARLRLILPEVWRRYGSRLLTSAIGLFVVLTAIRFYVGADSWYRGHELLGVAYFQTVIFVSSTIIIAAISGERWLLAPALNSALLVSIGRVSYGLYVYHFFMPSVAPVVLPGFIYYRFPVASCVALSFGAAAASWFLIERPILGAKRLLPYGRNNMALRSHKTTDGQSKSRVQL